MKKLLTLFAASAVLFGGTFLSACDKGPDKQVDPPVVTPKTLTTDPAEVVLEPGVNAATVAVTTDASNVAATVPAEFTWIKGAEYVSGTLTITVEGYVGTQNRTGHVLLSSPDLAQDYTLSVTQKSAAPLDLAGTWSWTGEIWDQRKIFTAVSGSATSVYNDALGYYIFIGLPMNLAFDEIDGGVALRVGENNEVRFVVMDALDVYFDQLNFGTNFMGYYNFANFYNKSTNATIFSHQHGLPAETVVDIAVGADGNTITFPATGIHEGAERTYGFGFGYMNVVSLEDHTIKENASFEPAAVYRNLVFTRS